MKYLPGYDQYASTRQLQYLLGIRKHGSFRACARVFGVDHASVIRAMEALQRNAARQGWSPDNDMTKPTAPGFHVKGTSTLYDAEGAPKIQWVKTNIDKEDRLAKLCEAISVLCEPFEGKSKLIKPPKRVSKNLLAVYPMGDPHFGMYAWAEETGNNFDLDIAEKQMVTAVDGLVSLAPETDQALILNLGDYFHTDNSKNVTNQSGNSLDVDSRYQRMLEVGILTMEWVIRRALAKSKHVTVINNIGNHDEHTSVAMSMALWMLYKNNPRVTVDKSPNPFKYFRHGNVFLGTTHGDNVKAAQLPGIMATDRKTDWGESTWRFWYTGHVHHDSLKEFPGCVVETFRTLAPKDAWHNWRGYRSEQDMKMDLFHDTAPPGRIARHSVGIRPV